jgi:REP-associated tyrosine transposase
MVLPPQEIRTFFVTSGTAGRRNILQSERLALLLIDVFNENRRKNHFLLHEFVIMPDHIHLLITPAEDVSLEKAVQYIKGGFSFRAKRELGYVSEVWQTGFGNHRVKDRMDYENHRAYIRDNPIKRGLCRRAEMFAYSSANANTERDPEPPWLKPWS